MPPWLTEILAVLGLIALPMAISFPVARRAGRAIAKSFRAFADAMRDAGLPLADGSTPQGWKASGELRGIPVAIETYNAEFRTDSGKRSTRPRTAIRVPLPAPRMAVYRSAETPVTELGTMQEVTWDSPGYRAFAEDPEELHARVGPEVRRALLARKWIHSIDSTSGAWVLVVDGHQSNAAAIAELVEIVVAIHERRAPFVVMPARATTGFSDDWSTALSIAVVLGAVIGIPLACAAPPVQDLATPLVCERGTVRNVGTNKNPLRCQTPGQDVEEHAHGVTVLVGFNLVFAPVLTLLLVRAAVRRRRRDERPAPSEPKGPYR